MSRMHEARLYPIMPIRVPARPIPEVRTVQDFRDLQVWKKAHELTLTIYNVTNNFPSDERFGLTSQLRRACASICANLAEGCCRNSDKDFARFVSIALGSASEAEYFLLLASDLKYTTESVYASLDERIRETKRMLTGLNQRLRSTRGPIADG